ncbi:H/ACA ribonucleoprotein complex subunit GAR1/NAF1 [Sporobolomyces koalae]|uniref:H/ACA ribonucleoprotein complex subunit GAR1/NAF1 n=1 Tax=Sporobolomyces koalae TaxID=500713 RepID=UPI00317928B6
MGNSSSKQPPAEEPPTNVSPDHLDGDAPEAAIEPPAGDAMHDDSTTVNESTKDDQSAPQAAVIQEDEDQFKVPPAPAASAATPLSPNSTTLKALPADIEHILSLGANQDDLKKLRAADGESQGEIDQVVRELREKYRQAGTGSNKGVLHDVEKEMQDKGIIRNQPQPEVKGSGSSSNTDDSSSDSDDSSSSDSDSNARATIDANRKQTRTRRGQGRPAAQSDEYDDDDSDSGMAGTGSRTAPKTEHELAEPEVVLPEVMKIGDSAEIAKFGKVESVIETVVVVKADTSGDWRVLDEGTVVCWEDRTVIGTIFETFGSVQQPFYSLRFPASSPPDPAVFKLQRPVFYAPSHAQFVFTRDLRSLKGSDASNVWDEEVGAGEIEFSDDEEEAEYKRRLKAERKARNQSSTPAATSGRQPSRAPSNLPAPPASARLSLPARPAISYADTDPVPSTSTGTSSNSAFGLYGAPVASTSSSNKSGPRAEMGEKPPPGRIGRQMFERDTGGALGEGDQVEFEFSDGDGASDSDSDIEIVSEGKRLKADFEQAGTRDNGRGRGRGRGGAGSEGRGRGRGGAEGGRGRGRGRGGAQERGRGGRGGRGGGRGGERQVAPLPARASPSQRMPFGATPAGLPPRPTFDLPEGVVGGTDERMSIDTSQAPAFAPPIRFGDPTSFGGPTPVAFAGASSKSPPQQNRPQPRQQAPTMSQAYNPQAPYPNQPWNAQQQQQQTNAYFRMVPPMHAPQQAYYPAPPSTSGSYSAAYSPHQPQAAFPNAAAGHVNPRFLAQQQQQQQQQQGAQGQGSQANQYPGNGAYGSAGSYGGYGGYGYGSGASGGGGAYNPGYGQGR